MLKTKLNNLLEDEIKKKFIKTIIVTIICFTVGIIINGVLAGDNENTFYIYLYSVLTGLMGWLMSTWILFKTDDFLKDNSLFYSIAAFIFAAVAMGVAYADVGFSPFGDKTMLLIDAYHQYAPFFIDLKDRIFSGESLLYTDSVAMGASYLPQFAYYLASPLNLIALFFPKDYMTEAMALIQVLKAGLSALFFSLFVRGVFKKNNWIITAVSVMYALSAFTMTYNWNIMWFDSIALLPLVALGLYKLVNEGKYLLYSITLALSLICNFYIGFMVCLAMVIYFFASALEKKCGVKQFLIKFKRFAIGSLIGGGMSAFIILPTYIALQLTSSANDILPQDWTNNFTIIELIGQHLFGVPLNVDFGELPNIYCGVIVILLATLYVLNDGINLRQKLIDLSLAAIMFFSMLLNIPDWIWHGLHYPNGLPYRFAFVYIFAILILSLRVLLNLDKIKINQIWASLGVSAGVLVLCEMADIYQDNFKHIYVTLVLIVIYAAIMLVSKAKKYSKQTMLTLLAFVMLFEICGSCIVSVHMTDKKHSYATRTGFYNNYNTIERAIDWIEEEDPDSDYRIGQLPTKTCNDASTWSYRGMTSFSSSTPQSTITLLSKLGYANNGVNSCIYNTFLPVQDSFFGVKYFVTENHVTDHNQLKLAATIEAINEDERTVYIYRNDYALSLGFTADNFASQWNWDKSENPFKVMNDFIYKSTGIADVYQILPIEIDYESGLFAQVMNNDTIDVTIDEVGQNGSVSVSAAVPENGRVFAYGKTTYLRSIEYISENGIVNLSEHETFAADLGNLKRGDSASIKIEVDNDADGCLTIAMLDNEKFEDAMDILNSSAAKFESAQSGCFKGTVSSKSDNLFVTTIPYDEGWQVWVDGEKTDTIALGDALLAFDISKGEHTIELKFWTKGLTSGIIISLISAIILIIVQIRRRKNSRKNLTF